jgi:predicted NAD/FAD-binding protein
MFEHPIYSPEAIAAQKALPLIQGKRNTWFCGAHWRNGFHEDGLASAVAVAQGLGAEVPW